MRANRQERGVRGVSGESRLEIGLSHTWVEECARRPTVSGQGQKDLPEAEPKIEAEPRSATKEPKIEATEIAQLREVKY